MSQQIQITGGAKVRDLQDVIIGTSGVLSSVAFDVANGVPRLDSNGKILVSQLPNSVMEYKGTWNAATNTPTLANGTGNQGDVYLCNVAGTVNFGAGPIAFIVGDSAVYSGSIWQRSGGATGSVTSVGLSTNGGAITIGSSPVTTSGVISFNFNGTNLQYVNGAGNLTTFPTLITSIGLSMPSAFSVANSPLTANGTIAVTGAGYASQYIRGDGTLADFPSSGGGGSSVSYYLNGGTSQGTIGGVTYYEMSKTADTGTGVDFTKSGDGFIVAFLTDANDPALLNIPAGNWNYEIYASMSANGGTPQMYAELYKYDGMTFTLISTSTNEILYDGTNLNLYTFGMTVPATTLTLTDRLAIKLYATNSGGKTTTIHTQDSHLCQVITTFSTGITALNGLTAQVQYFQTGTSGTDFNISSTTATHTFNIPSASATNRGLITTGSQTIAGSKTFNATLYGTDSEFSGSVLSPIFSVLNGTKVVNLQSLATLNRDIYLPDASGTIALTSALANYVDLTTAQTIGGTKTFSDATKNNGGILLQNASSSSLAGYMNVGGLTNGVKFTSGGGISNTFTLPSATGYTFTFPNATGTLALTSDIPSITGLVPYTGATTNVNLGSNSLTAFNLYAKAIFANNSGGTSGGAIALSLGTTFNSYSGFNTISAAANGVFVFSSDISSGAAYKDARFDFGSLTNSTIRTYTFPDVTGTVALTSNLASYVPYTGATGAVNLGFNSLTTNSINLDGNSASGVLNIKSNTTLTTAGASYVSLVSGNVNQLSIWFGAGNMATFTAVSLSTSRTYTLPDASGTIALVGGSGVGTVTSVAALTIGTTGTDVSSSVANSTTTPVITLNVPTASATNRGALSSTDWTTFNNKYNLPSLTSGSVLFSNGSTIAQDNANFFWDDTNNRLGIGTASPAVKLHIIGGGEPLRIESTNATGGNYVQYKNASGDLGYIGWGSSANNNLNIVNQQNAGITFLLNSTEKMILDASGNLTLGSTAGTGTGSLYAGAIQSKTAAANYGLTHTNGTVTIGTYIEASNTYASFGTSTNQPLGFFTNNNAPQLYLHVNGNFGVNTTTDAGYKLDVNGTGRFSSTVNIVANASAQNLVIQGRSSDNYGQILFYSNNAATRYGYLQSGSPYGGTVALVGDGGGRIDLDNRGLNVTGAATFSSSVTATSFFESSDSRLKTLIQDNYQTKGIASITPKLYTKNGKVELGYYAQDFVGVLDSAVSKGSDDMLSLSYREVHTAKIYALEQEIKDLKAKMN